MLHGGEQENSVVIPIQKPLSMGDLGRPYLIHATLGRAHPSGYPKQHLNQSSSKAHQRFQREKHAD